MKGLAAPFDLAQGRQLKSCPDTNRWEEYRPQGLKPASWAAPSGTAEAVPFPKPILETAKRDLFWRGCVH